MCRSVCVGRNYSGNLEEVEAMPVDKKSATGGDPKVLVYCPLMDDWIDEAICFDIHMVVEFP